MLRARACHFMSLRFRGPRLKPKMVHKGPAIDPTRLALDFFDFYYGQLFERQWPSIRLALLSPKRHVAILNNFSPNFEVLFNP